MEPFQAATELCRHHERIQAAKAAGGKRAWFDQLGEERIYVRQSYRLEQWNPAPGRYLHPYRAGPIARFRDDLT